ncbi:hypothetical protein GW17_00011854 [Ensete ventricosum]|nr:hypothetical protein GW17_00011854 [Ensete ventricosum]
MDGQLGWGTLDNDVWRKGPWTAQEDKLLMEHVSLHGDGKWNSVSKLTGLRRNGKSCRLSLPGRTDNEIKNYWRTHFKKSKPSKNVEQARARHLIRQRQEKKQGQEEQQHLHHQGAQQQQADMRAPMKQAEEAAMADDMAEMTYMYSVSQPTGRDTKSIVIQSHTTKHGGDQEMNTAAHGERFSPLLACS